MIKEAITSIRGALGTGGLAVAMLAGLGGGDAEAAAPGTPIQLAAPNACLANLAIGGCSPFSTFKRPLGIDISPDGADVYMANQSGSIGRFRRDPSTNALTGGTFVIFGGGDLSDVFVAPSGTFVLGAGGSTSGDGMLESFARDPSTGALTNIACAEEGGSLFCANAEGIGGANEVALPPSGPGVYVAAQFGGPDGPDGGSSPDGSIASFTLSTSGGSFKQLECIAAIKAASGACSKQSKDEEVLKAPMAVAVSPDGSYVYFGGSGGLVGFNRDPASGKLVSEAECMLRNASIQGCPKEARLPITDQIVISPDGEFLYAGDQKSFTVFDRNPVSGTLSVVECFKTASSGAPCPVEPAFGGGAAIATSPDGSTVYVAGGTTGEGFLRSFRVDKATGKLSDLACVTVASVGGCTPGAGMMWPSSADVTADGTGLYVLGYEGTGTGDLGALAEFRIEQPPAGPPAPVTAKDSKVQIEVLGKRVQLDKKGVGKVRLKCPASEQTPPCSGKLTLQTKAKFELGGGGKASKRRKVKLASGKFSIGAGKTASVKVKVGQSGLELLSDTASSRQVTATVAVKDGAGNKGTARKQVTVVPKP